MPIDIVGQGLRPTRAAKLQARDLTLRNPQLDELRQAVRVDPSLTVATLRHAYKTQRDRTKDCTDIEQVVTRLGSLAMVDVLEQLSRQEPLDLLSERAARIVEHSTRVAVLSCEISTLLNHTDTARIYMTGLLHDIGKLLTIQSGEFDYLNVPARFNQPDLLNIHERRTLGYDHAKLGWHALSIWGVPEPIPTVVAWHHQGSRAYSVGGDIARMVAVVRSADLLERMLDRIDELDDLDMWRLERNLACRRLGLTPEMIRRQWTHLRNARAAVSHRESGKSGCQVAVV